MMAEFRRPDVQQIAIVLTDGVSNIDKTRTIPEAEQAKAENIQLFVIGEVTLRSLLFVLPHD